MAEPLYNEFPDLPAQENGAAWPYNVSKAYDMLSSRYTAALEVLRREDGDALRLRHHSQRIFNNHVPILKALADYGFHILWLETCMHTMGRLTVGLEAAAAGAERE
jgi:hypothetical protein